MIDDIALTVFLVSLIPLGHYADRWGRKLGLLAREAAQAEDEHEQDA